MSERGDLLSRLKVTRHAKESCAHTRKGIFGKKMSDVLLFMVFDAIVLSTNFHLDLTDFDKTILFLHLIISRTNTKA